MATLTTESGESCGEGISLAQAKRLLGSLAQRPRKSLGQHFLVDRGVLGEIAGAADLGPEDVVIEVGPGLGILTLELARHAGRVIAVEIDERLAGHLRHTLAGCPNVTIVSGDILSFSPGELLESYAGRKGLSPTYKVVANLPYYITSMVLRHFLSAARRPGLMVVTVQLEVAEAIVAGPGQLSQLAISVQVFGTPRIVAKVSPRSFYPPPRVSSAVLCIDLREQPKVPPQEQPAFFQLVEAGFSTPRKQLHNSLALGLGLEPAEVARRLREAGIDPARRAQTLGLEEWSRLVSGFGDLLGKEQG